MAAQAAEPVLGTLSCRHGYGSLGERPTPTLAQAFEGLCAPMVVVHTAGVSRTLAQHWRTRISRHHSRLRLLGPTLRLRHSRM